MFLSIYLCNKSAHLENNSIVFNGLITEQKELLGFLKAVFLDINSKTFP